MSYLGRKGAVAPLTSADIPAGIVEGTDIAFFENASGTQNLGGTYSTERMYLNDSYTLTGDVNITNHLALGTVADADVVITDDGSTRTITGSGTLETGELMNERQTSLTGMTGELGSVVTGSPAITGVGTLTSGSIASTVTGFTGIKELDIWRLNTHKTFDSTGEYMTANLERCDDPGFEKIGTGITETSGVFTFPSTGKWFIQHHMRVNSNGGGRSWIDIVMEVTTDDDFSGSNVGYTVTGLSTYTDQYFQHGSVTTVFDVDNISNCKVRFKHGSHGSIRILGSSTSLNTYIIFMRIGDT